MISTVPHLLVVDDDARLRDLLTRYLRDHDYLVTSCASAHEADTILAAQAIDLMILDVMMPEVSGIDFLTQLRQNVENPKRHLPVLMLTALAEVENRIAGLEAGSDDYLPKPFDPKELLLRIQRILRRIPQTSREQNILRFSDKTFDVKTQILREGEAILHLTSVELGLLKALVANPRMTLTRDELAERSGVSLSPRTVDVQITRLRKKIETDPKHPIYLRTVRHKGYSLWPDA